MKDSKRKKQEQALDKFIGKKIRKQRLKLNLSQEDLSKLMGCSYQLIQKQESGVSRINASVLFDIAKNLGVGTGYFYEGFEPSRNLEVTLPQKGSIVKANVKKNWDILAIEDSAEDSFLLKKVFDGIKTKQNFNLKICHDGQEGYCYLRDIVNNGALDNLPDLVLIDLNVPGKNGFDLLKIFKSDRNLLFIPMIVMTNSINAQEMLECYKMGASGYVVKSFDIYQFEENIKMMLDYWTKAVVTPRNY